MTSTLDSHYNYTSTTQRPSVRIPSPPLDRQPTPRPLVIPRVQLVSPSPLDDRTIGRYPQRPLSRRKSSASIARLNLDAARSKEHFGLGNLQVSTSPDHRPPTDLIDCLSTPLFTAMNDNGNMSKLATPSINTSSTPSSGARTPTNGAASPGRRQYPPSPLSQISHDDQPQPNGVSVPPPSASSVDSPTYPSSQPGPAQSSPCFIHSQLDRHGTGSLQDWLKNKSSQSEAPHHASRQQTHTHRVGTHTTARHEPYAHPRGAKPHQQPKLSASPTATPSITSSTDSTLRSNGGYETDPSSLGGAIDEDDDEEGGSLTRQLAETAQGVREMSKELGRTRVRSRIQHVLIVTKARDNRLIKLTRELALYLMQKKPVSSPEGHSRNGDRDRGMIVYVDAQLEQSKRFDAAGMESEYPDLFKPVSSRRASAGSTIGTMSSFPSSSSVSELSKRKDEMSNQGQLRYWTAEMCSTNSSLFDFVVTLGGDGTVLFTSWLFQRIVPPVLPFALGSLGFLTNFDFSKYKETMDRVIDDGIRVNLRMRFTCTVYRAIAPEDAANAMQGKKRKAIKKHGGGIIMSQVDKGGWDSLEAPFGLNDDYRGCSKDKEIMCFSTKPVEQFEVLNDLVVDRGPSPFVSLLELFGDEQHLTTVQADGLTVSTPTGSTAYSLSAGGSLVHPQIPALLITPICPHTLSFRPMLLPDSMELRICVPYNSRSTAWASFDGRGRVELKQGDHIKVTASKYPFPTVCADKASNDWFSAISRTLRWNEREKQKSFVVVEEDGEPSSNQHGSKSQHRAGLDGTKSKNPAHQHIEEEDEDDEEEEQFDIDDKSSGDATNPSSPHMQATNPKVPPLDLLSKVKNASRHTDGIHSPDRYVASYEAPPAISQRHLIEALAAAEINAKDGEVGDRDDIRTGQSNKRMDGHRSMIPSGRSQLSSPSDPKHSTGDLRTPRAPSHSLYTPRSSGHHHEHHGTHTSPRAHTRRTESSKAKAFAFFGQDDSASDLSDPSE